MMFDGTDLMIVELLQEDGRRGNRSVGRHLGLSEGAIRKRLRRMEELETIVYGLVVDVEAAGVELWAWLEVQTAPTHADAVAEMVASLDCCTLCSLTSDRFNIRAVVGVSDLPELAQVVDRITGQTGVRKVDAREIAENVHHKYNLVLPSERWGMID